MSPLLFLFHWQRTWALLPACDVIRLYGKDRRPDDLIIEGFQVTGLFEHDIRRDGSSSEQKAPLKKSIYSLYQLFTIMKAANYRYLEFISSFDDHSGGKENLTKVTDSAVEGNMTIRPLINDFWRKMAKFLRKKNTLEDCCVKYFIMQVLKIKFLAENIHIKLLRKG